MSEEKDNKFVGYEYRDITVNRDMENLYLDGYQNFGWKLDGSYPRQLGLGNVTIKFKRDRKIRNKAELTRLQRQFDATVSEIDTMEKSKTSGATIAAFTIGIIGTAFLAGATFAFLANMIIPCIVLAVPGFVGWILPYFRYKAGIAKKTQKVSPLIDNKYDVIYETCEKANSLLGQFSNDEEYASAI